MILRFSKAYLLLLFFSLLWVGAFAQAQESKKNKREQPKNIVEVYEIAFQPESSEIVVNKSREVLKKSKLGISDFLEKSRKDLEDIQQESSRALKFTRQANLPTVNFKKDNPRQKTPSQLVPEVNNEIWLLEDEIQQAPLKGYQAKLVQFSAKIKELLRQLRNSQREEWAIFLDLGKAYLGSQRFLNSLNSEHRLKLTIYASRSKTALGSYELALWTFKMVLFQNPNDGDTNFLMGKIFSEMGYRQEALERAKNAEHLFTKNQDQEKAAQTRSFIESL